MQTILELHEVTKRFGTLTAVDGVDCCLARGQTLAVVGGSGCGKSTLARIMAGMLRPDSGRVTRLGRVQMVFQDPWGSFDPLYPMRASLKEAMPRTAPADQAAASIDRISRQVGIDPDSLQRHPDAFSGGQRQRLAIARALLACPDVLVLDEPTASLDVLTQRQIIDLLIALKTQMGLSIIFISHNLRVVRRFADTIAVMRAGRLVEMQTTEMLCNSPQNPYTIELIKAAFGLENAP